jgi:predicted branched-subunit amino acid permease
MWLSWETRLFFAVLVLVCVTAAWKGGTTERRGAGLFFTAWFASAAAQSVSGRYSPVISLALIDAALFAALVALAWRSRRSWPSIAALLQAVALAAHAAFAVKLAGERAYITALTLASYGQLLALLIGTLRHRLIDSPKGGK